MKAVIGTWSEYNRYFSVSCSPDFVTSIVLVPGVERVAWGDEKNCETLTVFVAPDADFDSVMAAVELALKK